MAADCVTAYLPLVRKLTGRLSRLYPWLADDFHSDALLALWQAALEWSPSKGAKQTTFFWNNVKWALYGRLDLERKKNRAAFFPQVVDNEDKPCRRDPRLLADDGPPPDDSVDHDEAVDWLLAPLSPDMQRLVMRRVVDGDTLMDLARDYGTSKDRVAEMFDAAVRTVREATTVAG